MRGRRILVTLFQTTPNFLTNQILGSLIVQARLYGLLLFVDSSSNLQGILIILENAVKRVYPV